MENIIRTREEELMATRPNVEEVKNKYNRKIKHKSKNYEEDLDLC
tara:strand:- start:144 stop:278 length:135 start_codon:yes stop_codon:yes gene_type:complete